jgi:hypothetical protein
MSDPMQLDPDRLRVVLDHGEVVELDGGMLVLDGDPWWSKIAGGWRPDPHRLPV